MEQFNVVKKYVKLATLVKGNPKVPFSIVTTPRCETGHYSFTFDPYLIMLSVKQEGIKYWCICLCISLY